MSPLLQIRMGNVLSKRQSWAELLLPFLLNWDGWILFVYFLLSGTRLGLIIAGSVCQPGWISTEPSCFITLT